MGCSICLDVFGEDDDKGLKPVALPCGHVFHRMCSDGWLKACRTKGDAACCPLCKKGLGDQHSLPLYPTDVHDLDEYLAHRNRRMEKQRTVDDKSSKVPAAVALDRYMSRDAQANLLGKLMDFRQHINAYVMAVNNVSMSAHGGDDRIFRLFMDTTKATGANAEFRDAIKALNGATAALEEAVATSEHGRRRIEEKKRKAEQNATASEAMRTSWQKHMETKAAEEQRMHAEHQRVIMLQRHHKSELQKLERARGDLAEERKSLINEAREKAAEATRARVEAAQVAAQSRGDANAKVNELQKYVEEQERLRIEAEDRAHQANAKGAWLADRNALLSKKLDAARAELKAFKDQITVKAAPAAPTPSKGKAKQEEKSEGEANEGDGEEDDSHSGASSGQGHSQDVHTASSQLDQLQHSLARQSDDSDDSDAIIIEDDEFNVSDYDEYLPMMSRNTTLHPSSLASRAITTTVRTGNGLSRSGAISWSGSSNPHRGVLLPGSADLRRSYSLQDLEEDQDDSIEVVSVKRPRTTSYNPIGHAFNPTARMPSGISNSIASNEVLMDRVVQGHTVTGPRQRRGR